MKRFCERCELTTDDGHLWCQERDCRAEEGWPIFDYGDYLGDLKITRLISIWRTAALYEAERGSGKTLQIVWVKVAHANPECENRLREEGKYLQERLKSVAPLPQKGLAGLIQSFQSSPPRSVWLQLLPAAPLRAKSAYSETTVRGMLRVYSVYTPLKGVTLREAILENPQVWHYEAAWSMLALLFALKPIAGDRRVNLSLTPRTVFIDTDEQGHWRPTLLDLGWLVSTQDKSKLQNQFDVIHPHCEPAYTAPELVADRRGGGVSLSADVYSIGLIYFEMLSGQPGILRHWRRDEMLNKDVLEMARKQQSLPIDEDKFRPELNTTGVVAIIEKAINPRERYASTVDFAKALGAIYGNPPAEKRLRPIRQYVLIGVVLIVCVVVLVLIALSAGGGQSLARLFG